MAILLKDNIYGTGTANHVLTVDMPENSEGDLILIFYWTSKTAPSSTWSGFDYVSYLGWNGRHHGIWVSEGPVTSSSFTPAYWQGELITYQILVFTGVSSTEYAISSYNFSAGNANCPPLTSPWGLLGEDSLWLTLASTHSAPFYTNSGDPSYTHIFNEHMVIGYKTADVVSDNPEPKYNTSNNTGTARTMCFKPAAATPRKRRRQASGVPF